MKSRAPEKLAKLLVYALGRRPDEFGLVPDDAGYVKTAELLKALNEEADVRHVAKADIREVLMTLKTPPIEVNGNRIRAIRRDQLLLPALDDNPPKLLYTAVRRRAHAHVFLKGIQPMGRRRVILTTTRKMAIRIGKRIDPVPIILTVNVNACLKLGLWFQRCGQLVLSAEPIPVQGFSGPPPPKAEPAKPKPEPVASTPVPTPGSFFVEPSVETPGKRSAAQKGRKKDISWKKDRRLRKRR